MDRVQLLHDFEQLKILADARRLRILRLLMQRPATLTELAASLGQSPAWVRHHLLALQSAGLIELDEVRVTGKVTEKFYRAKAGALLLREVILPETAKPVVLFAGSDDPALTQIARHLEARLFLLSLPVGSLDGLITLRQGLCQLSGAHLLDASGEYNLPFVQHLFPDRGVRMVTLAHRTQGWMLAPGNPRGIKGVEDLARRGVRFVNRNPGSGTRLWIDSEMRRIGLPPEKVRGYDRQVSTHEEAAGLVQSGEADISLGLQAAAQGRGLDFLPLFEERYDLVLLPEHERLLLPLLDYLQTAGFRKTLASLAGYNSIHTGQQIHSLESS
jgi:putative molybdopterin biosynthesis protein